MRIGALIKRILQQMLRDKRTLGLVFIAPLLVLTLMYYMFNSNSDPSDLKLGVVGIHSNLVQVFKAADFTIVEENEGTKETVINDDLDALLQIKDGRMELILENSDPSIAKALQIKLNQAIAAHLQNGPNSQGNAGKNGMLPGVVTQYVYGNSETNFFDVLSPVLVGYFVFFFVFLISGIGLLRERTTGTLERLMSTPIRRGEVITGYLAGYGIFAVIQTIIVVTYSINVLDITLVGSFWVVLLINLLLALVALSLGILLSTFASSEFQMVQFIPLVIIPQIFFAGIFPLESMDTWLQVIGKFMPIYYGADALKGVMYKGFGFNEVWFDLLILFIFASVFIILNMFALKKYRKL